MTRQQFSAGYTDTADVWVYIKLAIADTGSVIMLPTFLAGIKSSGVGEYFAGCYALQMAYLGSQYDPPQQWSLQRGRIGAVPSLIAGMAQMQCP